MIIVLEGLPGAGKTTIAKLLKREHSFGMVEQIIIDPKSLRKEGGKFKNPYFVNDEEKCFLAKKLANNHKHVVMDRNYISTLAFNYAAKFDPKNNSSFSIARKWYSKNYKKTIFPPDLYIYLRTPIQFCFSRKKRRENPENPWTDPDHLKKMKYFYENIFPIMEPQVPKITISGKLPIKNIIKKIIRCLE